MSLHDRAAQFSPFAALTGYSAAIAETGRLTDSRVILDEYEMARVDDALQKLQELLPQKPVASITYFVPDERKAGGAYQMIHGTVKRIDAVNGVLLLTDQRISRLQTFLMYQSNRNKSVTNIFLQAPSWKQ